MSNWKNLSEEQKEYIQNLESLYKEVLTLRKDSLELWQMQKSIELLELTQIANPNNRQLVRLMKMKKTLRLMKDVYIHSFVQVETGVKEIKKYLGNDFNIPNSNESGNNLEDIDD